MNRNKIILIVLLAIYLVVGVLSCAKKQGPDTPYTRMVGKWKLAKTGNDNGNGVIVYTPVLKGQDWEWTFNNNSTAIELNNDGPSQNPTENYDWKIVGADSLWMAGAWHDTTTYYLFSINSSAMTLTWSDTTTAPNGNKVAMGLYFTRG